MLSHAHAREGAEQETCWNEARNQNNFCHGAELYCDISFGLRSICLPVHKITLILIFGFPLLFQNLRAVLLSQRHDKCRAADMFRVE